VTTKLLLASTSRYRKALLERLDVPFESAAPEFDERSLDGEFGRMSHDAFATALALGKAKSLRPHWPDHFILAADQIAVLPGDPPQLLHKAGTQARAVAQLMEMGGRTHMLVTAVVLMRPGDDAVTSTVDHQRMVMRAFAQEEAERYVRHYQPLDCAGAYRIEDAGIRLFERIDGHDYTGIIGLPLLAVCRLLRGVGLLPA